MTNLKKKWALGFNDRGHGHGDFAVIIDTGKADTMGRVVVKCDTPELAKHLVELHNQDLERTNEILSEIRR